MLEAVKGNRVADAILGLLEVFEKLAEIVDVVARGRESHLLVAVDAKRPSEVAQGILSGPRRASNSGSHANAWGFSRCEEPDKCAFRLNGHFRTDLMNQPRLTRDDIDQKSAIEIGAPIRAAG